MGLAYRQSRTRWLGTCILRYAEGRRRGELYGSEPETTNNRMELKAAVEGLRALKESCEVEVVTDSNYLKGGITEWIHRWKANGWRTASKKPVSNQDLWEELDEQVSRHKTKWSWTKGHASHADNNRWAMSWRRLPLAGKYPASE